MRRYEGYQIDRSIESWFRSNISIIMQFIALVIALIIAYLHLSALIPGVVKNYFYVFYFIMIAYNIIVIGVLASGNHSLAKTMGAWSY